MRSSVAEEIRTNEIEALSNDSTLKAMARELFSDGAVIDWQDGEFKAAIIRRYGKLTHRHAPANGTDMRDALRVALYKLKAFS